MQVKNSVTNKIISFISQNNLFNNNDRILIAVSGGFDSTFLVDIIYNIQNLFKIDRIAIAHINYNLRGNDSINDKNFVIDLSKKYQFEIFTLDIDLKEYIKSNKIKDSLENIARNIRYEFIKDISLNNNFNKIVLAHNANDHAETILLKLIRGTVTGLKGIEVKKIFKGLELVRPILCISREEIENYCIHNNLYPRTDITNHENDYTRNRIRNNLLPLILKENPNFLESIYNSSIIFNREDKYLDKKAISILESLIIKQEKEYIIIDKNKLINHDEVLVNRIIKLSFSKIKEDNNSFSYKHIKSIFDNIYSNISNKIIELPKDHFFYKDKNYLIFSKNKINLTPKEFLYKLEGIILIKELDLIVKLLDYTNDIIPNKTNLAFSIEHLDKIEVKSYNENIKFIPFGKNSSISLKEYMDKNKVPKFIRKDLIMIYINNVFLGIPNYIRTNNFLLSKFSKSYYFNFETCI